MRNFINSMMSITAILTILVVTAGYAGAVDIFPNTCGASAANTSVCQDVGKNGAGSQDPVVSIIKDAINIISYVIGAAAIIGILVSAIRMITASGDSNAISTARTGIIYSLIGIVVAICAQAIVAFVIDKVT